MTTELQALYDSMISCKSYAKKTGEFDLVPGAQAAFHNAIDKEWPDIAAEITRLTSEVEQLEESLSLFGDGIKDRDKTIQGLRNRSATDRKIADALADAVERIVSVQGGVAGAKEFDTLLTALTAFKEGN